MTDESDVVAPLQAAEACTCNPLTIVIHESGTCCGDPQFEWMVERVLAAMQGDNFVSVADAKRIDDIELEAAEAVVKEICSWAQRSEPERCVCNGGWSVDENYQPEEYEAHEPLRPEKGLIPCGHCNHGGWDAPWPPVAAQPPTSEASPQ